MTSHMDKHESKETDWKWRYTFWTGIMYEPIPVGIIILATLCVCFVVYKLTNQSESPHFSNTTLGHYRLPGCDILGSVADV